MSEVDPKNLVTKQEVDAQIGKVNLIMAGVVIVLFIGFVTVLVAATGPIVDAWRFRSSSYESLIKQVSDQDTLIELQGGKTDNLTDQVNYLKYDLENQKK